PGDVASGPPTGRVPPRLRARRRLKAGRRRQPRPAPPRRAAAHGARLSLRLAGWSLSGPDVEPEVSEDLDRARLPALEITGSKTLSCGELVRRAEDRLRRVAAFLPDQLIRRGRGETVLGEELLRPQPVVLLQGAHDVIGRHLGPLGRMCHRLLSWAR